jgi:hypothetical protein
MSDEKNPIVPRCKAMLLCDQAIVEEGTNKISLINILANFKFSEFPGETPACTLFVQLVDATGPYKIAVEIHDLAGGTMVGFMHPIEVQIDDRLAAFNLLLPISPIPIPHAGAYDVVVLVDGEELEHQRYVATRIETQE